MCGGAPEIPKAVDPAVEQAKADAAAAKSANNQAATSRRLRKQSALASGASASYGTAQTSSVLAQGKPTLGS